MIDVSLLRMTEAWHRLEAAQVALVLTLFTAMMLAQVISEWHVKDSFCGGRNNILENVVKIVLDQGRACRLDSAHKAMSSSWQGFLWAQKFDGGGAMAALIKAASAHLAARFLDLWGSPWAR